MIPRALWYLGLALIAVITTGLQLDKQAHRSPDFAHVVPEPFRAFAQAWIAEDALAGADAQAALEAAQVLVARRPVPAEHLTLLALAQLKAGDSRKASQSIQLSAQRGWREITAQETLARLALEAGNGAEASRRYIALLVQSRVPDEMLLDLGPLVFAPGADEARSTMAEIISGSVRWTGLLLARGPRVMPPDAFADVMRRSIARGAVYDCGDFERAVRILARRDNTAGAALAADPPAGCTIDRSEAI